SRRTAGSVSCAAGRRLDGGPGRAAAAPFWAAAAPFCVPEFNVLKKPSSLARASQRDAPRGSGGLESCTSVARLNAARALPLLAAFSGQASAAAGSRGPFTPLRWKTAGGHWASALPAPATLGGPAA